MSQVICRFRGLALFTPRPKCNMATITGILLSVPGWVPPHTTEQSSALCCSWLKLLNSHFHILHMHAKANASIIPYVAHSLYGLFRFLCIYFYGKTRNYFFSAQPCCMGISLDDLPAVCLIAILQVGDENPIITDRQRRFIYLGTLRMSCHWAGTLHGSFSTFQPPLFTTSIPHTTVFMLKSKNKEWTQGRSQTGICVTDCKFSSATWVLPHRAMLYLK